MNSQLKLIAEQMTEEEILNKIIEYQIACDKDKEHMEIDTSDYWWNDLNMNTRMLINYERILKINQSVIR